MQDSSVEVTKNLIFLPAKLGQKAFRNIVAKRSRSSGSFITLYKNYHSSYCLFFDNEVLKIKSRL